MTLLYKMRVPLAGILAVLAGAAGAQSGAPPVGQGALQQQEPTPFILRTTTREVLVDVVATDRRNHPIRDLKAEEIVVLEVKDHERKDSTAIASFHSVDAAVDLAPPAPQSGGFRVSLGGDCAMRATFHYEISFHPDEEGWRSGYHEIEVRTTRPGVKLAYHTHYYVGERNAPEHLPSSQEAAKTLRNTACFHPDVPPSIGLNVKPIETGLKDVRRYFVTVDADSLAFISVSADNRRVQLDYGVCTFDAQGKALRYFNSAADRVLSSQEYAQAVVHGLPNLLELPDVKDAAVMRVVVRDRTTGNVGVANLGFAPQEVSAVSADPTGDENLAAYISLEQENNGGLYVPGGYYANARYGAPPLVLQGTVGSFGSIVPRADSFCGDVYPLAKGTDKLPVFWNLSSIGSLFTPQLSVPDQLAEPRGGVPGVLSSTEWFGIDYHSVFYIAKAGTYEFKLMSDDGARLIIDETEVINLDGVHQAAIRNGRINLSAGEHTMRVAYFQGPLGAVALALAVRGPEEKNFRIFDLRQFTKQNAAQ